MRIATRKSTKKTISAFLKVGLALLLPVSSMAQSRNLLRTSSTDSATKSIAEYFYTRTGNEILQPVKILGGVDFPGIYHVPRGTDLSTLISISGGFSDTADPSGMLYSAAGKSPKVVDIRSQMGSGKEIMLGDGDIVYVPRREGLISPETATTLTVLISILSVGLTAYIVDRAD